MSYNPPHLKINVKIGARELDLLRHIASNGPMSVGDVHAGYGVGLGYARGTVLQMMERLRKKGFLAREDVEKIFRYSVVNSPDDVEGSLVGSFVETHLGGSITPFLHYIEQSGSLSKEEVTELEALVRRLADKVP